MCIHSAFNFRSRKVLGGFPTMFLTCMFFATVFLATVLFTTMFLAAMLLTDATSMFVVWIFACNSSTCFC